MIGRHTGRGHHHGAGGHHGRGRRDEMGERMHGRGGRERMFEQGGLKLVVLHLLQEKPRHGYEIIKAIEELAGGEYSPSPGVIYPTLTLLEELGQAAVTETSAGKKQYGITPAGAGLLDAERVALARTLERLQVAGSVADARRAPELQRSMQNFKTALHFRLGRDGQDGTVLRRIADVIDRAAVEIERA